MNAKPSPIPKNASPFCRDLINKLEITDKEFHLAFRFWRFYYWHHQTDDECQAFLDLETLGLGRLKKTREALLISTNQAAKLMGVSKDAYLRIEKGEAQGGIRLAQLQKAADSLGCDLVYNLRPKQKVGFAWVIWEALCNQVDENAALLRVPRTRRWRALAAAARKSLRNARNRRQQSWSRRLFTNDGNLELALNWID